MTRAIVQAWDDENMAGVAWRWEVWVSRRADGSFSVGATQTTEAPPAAKVRTRTRLRAPAKVLRALQAVIAETGYGIAPDVEILEEIVAALAGFDPVLAWGLGIAALGPDYVLPRPDALRMATDRSRGAEAQRGPDRACPPECDCA